MKQPIVAWSRKFRPHSSESKTPLSSVQRSLPEAQHIGGPHDIDAKFGVEPHQLRNACAAGTGKTCGGRGHRRAPIPDRRPATCEHGQWKARYLEIAANKPC